jgi:hypothetical protein
MELTLVNSSLNEGTHWNWYSSSCGVDSVATGATVFVMPNDTSTYYVRGEGGCTNIFNCSSITANYNPASHLDLKMFLQGYYLSGGLMQTTLLNEGQASCANVTDTVFVDLYDPITQNMVHTVKAILHTDGTLRCNFAPFVGEYYIGIRHRNTIETWSSVPIVLGSELVSYDFSLAANKAFSNNMAEVEPGIWGMYCGDPNQDYAVDAFDYLILDPDIVNGANGYLVSDLNGDGSVDAFDYLILQPNIELGVGAQIPF